MKVIQDFYEEASCDHFFLGTMLILLVMKQKGYLVSVFTISLFSKTGSFYLSFHF